MKLRSGKALETGRLGVVLGLENTKAPSAKWISRRLGTSNSGINEAREAERFSLRSCKSNFGKKGANEDEIRVCIDNVDEDKGLFLGSEVLDPIKDLQVSFPDGEIKEESVECVHVEEGNKSSTSDIVNGDLSLLNDSKNGDGGTDKIVHKRGPGRPRKKKRKIMAVSGGDMVVYGGESVTIKRKRGRKRKNIEDSECNENEKSRKKKVEVRVSERVLELKSKAVTGGGGMVVDGGRPEKKKKKKKKLETRGRPRKKPIKTKTNEKVLELVCAAGTGGSVVVDGGTPEIKKVERRGRPRKIHGKTKTNEIPSMKKKKETRGRPRKIQVKETVPQKKKQLRDIIIKKLKIRKRIRNRKNRSKGKSVDKKDEEGKMGRGEYTKLVRKKVFDILVKAGWTFYRKPRLDRAYQDMVYVEPSGKCHWSITKAYTKLTKKVKDGYADNNEVNAFIQIPDDDMNMLFRPVYKNSGHNKNKKKDGKHIKKVNPTKKIQKGKNGIKYIKKVNPKKKIQKGISVKSRKPRLLARGLETGTKKQEIKKRNLVSWMIDTGVISSGSKVKYGKTRKRVYEGVISSDGIVCGCCDKSMSLSEFVNHCGGKVNGGFDDVYLEGGVSLRKCLMDSWRKEEELNGIRYNLLDAEGDDPNDDTCNICGDGGNLICCDGCPSTFHQTCLDIQNFPAGEWNCIHCLCKFCGVVSDIAPEKPPSEMLSCGLCEEKFHQSCVIKVGAVDMNSNTPPFCGQKCQELFERLQTYIGVKNELENGFSWTLLQRCDISQDLSNLKVENNSKLAVAFSVMDECFLPIVDKRSGTSIIHNVVYNCGSNFRRLNYAGFLTAVLEKGEELVTAASIRLHGSRLAEMPFIGTRHTYRRQGMCRRLLDAIESTLSTIGVEELIIPAIPALLQTWTKVFGFTPLEESKKQEIKSINMLVFPGIDMLQKPLLHSNPDCVDSHEKSVEQTANPNEINVSETTPKDTITDCDEIPADTSEITKNATEYEKVETTSSNAYAVEEDIMLMADSLCDLNFPVKNETFGPCSTESVTCQFLESEVVVEDNAVKESSLTLKNNFDLNLDPNIVVGDGNEERCDSRDLVLV